MFRRIFYHFLFFFVLVLLVPCFLEAEEVLTIVDFICTVLTRLYLNTYLEEEESSL